ncbi:hypothetical protein [Streptomyces sp. NPDC054901]
MNTAAGYAFAVRLIQPSLLAFRSYAFPQYTDVFREAAQDRLLETFIERSDARSMAQKSHRQPRYDICAALTVYGIELADLTPEGLLHYATECRKHGVTLGEHPADGCFAGTKCWPRPGGDGALSGVGTPLDALSRRPRSAQRGRAR